MKGGEWHVDHQLGQAHCEELWKTYAPSWWIAGQKGGASDISAKKNPDYWWHPAIHAPHLPFIWVPISDGTEIGTLIDVIHFGNNLSPGTLQDGGLEKCVEDDRELLEWLVLIAKEAVELGKLPGIQHSAIEFGRLASMWTGTVLNIGDVDVKDLSRFPFVKCIKHPKEVGILGGVFR